MSIFLIGAFILLSGGLFFTISLPIWASLCSISLFFFKRSSLFFSLVHPIVVGHSACWRIWCCLFVVPRVISAQSVCPPWTCLYLQHMYGWLLVDPKLSNGLIGMDVVVVVVECAGGGACCSYRGSGRMARHIEMDPQRQWQASAKDSDSEP